MRDLQRRAEAAAEAFAGEWEFEDRDQTACVETLGPIILAALQEAVAPKSHTLGCAWLTGPGGLCTCGAEPGRVNDAERLLAAKQERLEGMAAACRIGADRLAAKEAEMVRAQQNEAAAMRENGARLAKVSALEAEAVRDREAMEQAREHLRNRRCGFETEADTILFDRLEATR